MTHTQAAWLTTTTCYDEHARPIQVQTTNARLGADVRTLDFPGSSTQRVTGHQGPSHAPRLVNELFTYDHAGRALTTRRQLPGESRAALPDSSRYNALGQVTRKTLGAGSVRLLGRVLQQPRLCR